MVYPERERKRQEALFYCCASKGVVASASHVLQHGTAMDYGDAGLPLELFFYCCAARVVVELRFARASHGAVATVTTARQ